MALQLPPQIDYAEHWVARHQGEESFVLFRNTTTRTVNLYWLSIGSRTFHLMLQPGANCKTNTFTKHLWIFCDKVTNELLCVEHQKVFRPESYRIPDPNNPTHMIPCRKEINIHFPLRSLRDNCLWRVVKTLRTVPLKVGLRIIDERMCIPNVLKGELEKRLMRNLLFEVSTHPIISDEVEEQNVMQRK